MTVHEHSVEAFKSLDSNLIINRIRKLYESSPNSMTDREVATALGYTDMNAVRPRITALILNGHLSEVGSARDPLTRKRVRVVTVFGRLPAVQVRRKRVPRALLEALSDAVEGYITDHGKWTHVTAALAAIQAAR